MLRKTLIRMLTVVLVSQCAAAQSPAEPARAAHRTSFFYEGDLGSFVMDDLSVVDVIISETMDLVFTLFSDETSGDQIGPALLADGIDLADVLLDSGGLFIVELDFAVDLRDGVERWLEVSAGGLPLFPRESTLMLLGWNHARPAGPIAPADTPDTPDNAGDEPTPPRPADDRAAVHAGGSQDDRRGRSPGIGVAIVHRPPPLGVPLAGTGPRSDEFGRAAPSPIDPDADTRSNHAPGWQTNGNRIYYDSGNVGIGLSGPSFPLHIRAGAGRALFVENTATTGTRYGAYAETRSNAGRALVGSATSPTGTGMGVLGISNSDRGQAGRFIASSNTGVNIALFTKTNSNNGYGVFSTGGRNYMEGRLGIGKRNPQHAIDVNGTVNASQFLVNGAPINGGGGGGPPTGSAGGDLTGTYPNPQVRRLWGNPVSSISPSSGYVLKWYNNQWTPRPDETGGGGPPTGSAGGDLTGTYPNPQVHRLWGNPVSSISPSSGYVLKWYNNQWTPRPDETGGVWNTSGNNIHYNNGRVGIGTSDASHRLTIYDPTRANLRLIGPGSFGSTAKMNFGDAEYVYLQEDVDDRLLIYAVRGVGINQANNGNHTLQVGGTAWKSDGNVFWNTSSDIRIKTNIRDLNQALDRIRRVRPIEFRYTAAYLAGHPSLKDDIRYSVVAQEYAKVFPDQVGEGAESLPNGEAILQVNMQPMLLYSVAAIQELDDLLRQYKFELAKLEQKNQSMQDRLIQIEVVLEQILSGQ